MEGQECYRKPMTLCWSCAKACGGCSWSDGSFTPIPGWTAIKTKVRVSDRQDDPNRYADSFHVVECPLFEDDTDQYNKPTRRNKWNSAPYLQEVDA